MTITPQQFLSMPPTPDDYEEDGLLAEMAAGKLWQIEPSHPLLSTLERIAASLETSGGSTVSQEDYDALARSHSDVNQELDDLDAKHESLNALLEEIEAIAKPSTSKLAISVREAITAWRTGVSVEETDQPAEPIRGDEHNHDWASGNTNYSCACGAYIDTSDPAEPNGVVREPSVGSDG